jgi:hypothetical protein
MNIDTIRGQLNAYLIESEDAYWKNWVGLLDDIDMESLYRKYNSIFTMQALHAVKSTLQKHLDPEKIKQSKALLGQLILGYIEYASRNFQKEILKREAAVTVKWENADIPLRSLSVRILNETSRQKRKEMILQKEEAVEKELNPLRIQWVEKLFETVHEIGYPNYVALCEDTQNRDFSGFRKSMEQFLIDSEPVFLKYLDFYLRQEAGAPLDDHADEADLQAVFRCKRFDSFFPQSGLVDTVTSTLSGMGFELSRIHLDLEDRPKKKPRACVSAVNPPDDVRLTIYPAGGYDDYAGFLHEAGHAVHFSHEFPDLEFEYKFWGDRGFTEGTAYLFQHITMNTHWLTHKIGMSDPEAFIRFNAFMNILRFRRLIAQVLFQMDLFQTESVSGMKDVYRSHMETAHGVRYDASGYLNFDLELYSAGYLRARMFELQLRRALITQFGESWWNQPAAGSFLVPFYRNGRKSRADDTVLELGYEKLDPQLYLETQKRILI